MGFKQPPMNRSILPDPSIAHQSVCAGLLRASRDPRFRQAKVRGFRSKCQKVQEGIQILMVFDCILPEPLSLTYLHQLISRIQILVKVVWAVSLSRHPLGSATFRWRPAGSLRAFAAGPRPHICHPGGGVELSAPV